MAAFGRISYLGRHTRKYYERVARMVIALETDVLITKDSAAAAIADFALRLGMSPENVIKAESDEDFKKKLSALLDENTVCLFKCSMLDGSSQEILSAILA